jgi:O-antigen/teichoic acid export membrane protein
LQLKLFISTFAHVGALTTANVLHLCTLLISTILLGRTAGPEALGIMALSTATGSIMQSISTAGLHTVAIAALLRPDIDRHYELRKIFHSRLFVIPPIFIFGAFTVYSLPGIQLANIETMIPFFFGYAIGSFDIADLSHTALGNFQTIAWRRMVMLACLSPFIFYTAYVGNLELVLLLLAAETALWQLVLIPGAGLAYWPVGHLRREWISAAQGIWNVRSLWLASILGSIAQRVDLFIVGSLMTTHAAGQYSTASRPVEATTMVAGSLITVLFNAIARHSESPGAYAKFSSRAARALVLSSISLTVVVVTIGPFALLLLYGSQFSPAAAILPIYAISVVFIFQKQLLDRLAILENSYNLTLLFSFTFIATTVVLNLTLIPSFGLFGAAAAATLTHPVALLISFTCTTRGRRILAVGYASIILPERRIVLLTRSLIQTRSMATRV